MFSLISNYHFIYFISVLINIIICSITYHLLIRFLALAKKKKNRRQKVEKEFRAYRIIILIIFIQWAQFDHPKWLSIWRIRRMQQKLASVAGFEAIAKGETRGAIGISFTIEFQNGECGRICIIGQCAKMGNGAGLTNDMRTGDHLF